MLSKEQQDKLLIEANKVLGVVYKINADPTKAPTEFDCSTLTQYLYKQIGIDIPRSSMLQGGSKDSIEIPYEQNKLEVGDLLFMRSKKGFYNDYLFPDREMFIGHVVMYVGDNKVVHAKRSVGNVLIQDINELTQDPLYKMALVKRY